MSPLSWARTDAASEDAMNLSRECEQCRREVRRVTTIAILHTGAQKLLAEAPEPSVLAPPPPFPPSLLPSPQDQGCCFANECPGTG